MEKIRRIGETPLAISVYSVESKPTKINDAGILEIIFCLKGSVRFSYAYEEFTLHAGEFISVDKDAYYLYKGRDNLCVSFFIDLNAYVDRFPYINHMLFVCEGLEEGTTNFQKRDYNILKGLLISALKEINGDCDEAVIEGITRQIAGHFFDHFNICYYHYGSQDIDTENLRRLNMVNDYFSHHYSEKITLKDIAALLDLSEGYVSELMRRYSISFREMLSYYRANASERYLLSSDMTVMEISENCGFSDAKYYYAAFKRWYRCTPRQFRERYGRDITPEIRYLPVHAVSDLLDTLLMDHYRQIFVEGSGL